MRLASSSVPLVLALMFLAGCGGLSAEEKAKAERAAVQTTVRQYYAALISGNASRACSLMTPAEAKAAGDFQTEMDRMLNSAFGQDGGKTYDCEQAIRSTSKSLKGSEDAKYIRNPKFQSVVIKGNRASVVCCGGKIKPRLAKVRKSWLISGGLWGDQLTKLRENISANNLG